jgi:hypothetical protein
MTSFLLLLAVTPLQAQDARVLMVGNSYTASNALHELVAKALQETVPAWEQVGPQALTRGGATLADHAAEADGSHGDTTWRQALVTGPDAGSWDFVVLQDQSQVPGFPQSQAEWQASRDGAVVLDGLIQEGGGETFFLLTWGRRDGDSMNPSRFPDFPTMQDRLTEGYLAYAQACSEDGSPAWVIPAGPAWHTIYQDLVDAGQDPGDPDSAFYGLYSGDGSHPALPGSWLTALSAAATITGRSVAEASAPDGLDEELANTLRDAADRTVLDAPFGEIPYPWAFDWEEWLTSGDPDLEDGVTISDPVTRPAVVLAQPVELERAILGDKDDGAGRLWIGAGGELVLEQLESCDEDCAVVLDGGALDLAAGTLPRLDHRAGSLRVENLALEADYRLPVGSTLELVLRGGEQPPIDCDGQIILEGTLTLDIDQELLDAERSIVLARGASIEQALTDAALPEGAQLQIGGSGQGELLMLVWDTRPGETDDDHYEEPTPRSCECASSSHAPLPWWALIPLGLTVWRRRSRG